MNDDKDIKKYLRESDNIIIPKSISKGIDYTLTSLTENQTKHIYKKKSNKRLIIMIASIFLIIVLSINNKGVRASIESTIHKMESFFYEDDYVSKYTNYKRIIGETKVSNGVSITLREFFMDKERLYFNSQISNGNKKQPIQNVEYNIFINGEELEDGPSGATFQWEETDLVDILFYKDIYKIELNEVNDIKIIINKVIYEDETVLNGSWEYKFSFDMKSIKSVVKNIKVNKKIDLKGNTIKLDKMTINPFELKIKYSESKMNTYLPDSMTLGILGDNEEIILPWNTVTEYSLSKSEFNFNSMDKEEVTLLLLDKFPGENPNLQNAKRLKIKIK